MMKFDFDARLEKFYEIYHNPLYNKQKDFDYDKLKGDDKLFEDAIRTAFMSGWQSCKEEIKID